MSSRLVLALVLLPALSAGAAFAGEAPPPSHRLHVGAHAGWWDFHDSFRYEDEALLGLRAGAWIEPWFSLEVDLEHLSTRNKKVNEDSVIVVAGMHGRFLLRPRNRFAPMGLLGVTFMAADNQITADSITEGFDLGAGVRVRLGGGVDLLAEWLFRYQSVKVNVFTPEGELLREDGVSYVWSHGARLGVGFAF